MPLSLLNFPAKTRCASTAFFTATANSRSVPSALANSHCLFFKSANFPNAASTLPPYFFRRLKTQFNRASNAANLSPSNPTSSALFSPSLTNSRKVSTTISFFSRNSPAAPSNLSHSIKPFCTFPNFSNTFSSPLSKIPLNSPANSIILLPCPAAA